VHTFCRGDRMVAARQQRHQQKREARARSEMDACSFSPQINQARGGGGGGSQDSARARVAPDFVERLHKTVPRRHAKSEAVIYRGLSKLPVQPWTCVPFEPPCRGRHTSNGHATSPSRPRAPTP
jgi:hypothetical protein